MINIKELLSIEKHPKVQQTYILPSFENSKSLKIELQCDDDKYHKENFIYDFCQFCNIINIKFAKGDLFC
ncbi:hypothetical protein RCB45_000981 [Campylobacter coli]|nr:hypothetical protein [Campylobacter coli]